MNKILRADRTLYLLNDKGDENTFSAFVQPGRGKTMDEALELAKDIERCVNSHDALIEALRKITNLEHKLYGTDWEEITEAQEIAASALIAAGVEK